jgi:hypothetical protein
MEKSSQIAWKIVPLRHFFPLKVVPLIEVLLYTLGAKRPDADTGPDIPGPDITGPDINGPDTT